MRRGDAGRWAGLWDFPRFRFDQPRGGDALKPAAMRRLAKRESKQLVAGVEALTGIAVRPLRKLATFKHGVTRFRITLDCYLADSVAYRHNVRSAVEIAWVTPTQMDELPLSATGRKLARLAAEILA
jgi:A/G-specific adenine glycosylase